MKVVILSILLALVLTGCQKTPPIETVSSKPSHSVPLTPSTSPKTLNPVTMPINPALEKEIENLLEVIIANPDEKAVWRHPEEVLEIIAMDTDALAYFFTLFEGGIEDDDPKATVVMQLCREILANEDVNLITDRPGYWYDMYKQRVLRLRHLNPAASMAVQYPKSSVLLTVLVIPEDSPVAEPIVVERPDLDNFDASKPLADSEFVLFNGVRFGMSMEEVLAIIGEDVEFYDPAFPENQAFTHDGVFYGCYQEEGADTFILKSISFGDYSEHPAMRGIRFGDTIESVFDRFPVRDRELKQWAWQMLYGNMPTEDQPHQNYAALEFVADSYYSMRVLAENYILSLSFSRVEQRVIYISFGTLTS